VSYDKARATTPNTRKASKRATAHANHARALSTRGDKAERLASGALALVGR